MSTEQKPEQPHPQHKEHLETNALGHTLISSWDKFKQGKLISYRVMGLILIIVAAIGLFLYIRIERTSADAALWMELESANSLSALEEFSKNHPNTEAGRVADLDRARYLLGPDGIEKLPTAHDEGERRRAVENVEKARELFTKLLDQFKNNLVFKVECYVGLAKAEAALIGIPKDGSLAESKGSTDKLIEFLDKIATEADGTPWGEDAKKMSASLKGGKATELMNVQRSLYILAPAFPGGGPIAPGGVPPFGTGLPVLPGFPGGPVAPPTVPPTTPPDPKPGDPKPPDPKPPEPKPGDPKPPEPKPPAPKPPEPPAPKPPEPKPPEKK